jgi:thioredoxin
MPAVVTFKNGQEFSKAESINAGDLEKHVLYLLGTGPKPEQSKSSTGFTSGQAPGDGHPHTVTDDTFEQEVMRSSLTVLVDFWAPWCGPCKMVEPVVKKMAHELAGRLKVAKVNVDENPTIAQRYGIQSIPTMMVVKNGEIKDRWIGALSESAIRSRVNPHVG